MVADLILLLSLCLCVVHSVVHVLVSLNGRWRWGGLRLVEGAWFESDLYSLPPVQMRDYLVHATPIQ